MNSEWKIIIAFLFKRSGREELSFSDLYLTLSIDLNWFTPEDAKAFVNMAIKEKLLTNKNDLIKPNFDFNKIVVPVGFFPSKIVFEEKEVEIIKEENVLRKMVQRIVEKTKLEEAQVLEKINDIAKVRNLTKEVAALLFGKDCDILFEDLYEQIENRIVED